MQQYELKHIIFIFITDKTSKENGNSFKAKLWYFDPLSAALVNKNSAEGYVTTAKSSFSPGLLYLPKLLFYFGTSPQTTPVLLR